MTNLAFDPADGIIPADQSQPMTESAEHLRSNYDSLPYAGAAFWPSHPDHLQTVAALNGLASPSVTSCRVLEIGCAVGRNLLPMAQGLPGSRFLGIDLSPMQIEIGNARVGKLGLPNVELRCQDLMDLPADEGPFDYIIAHGVFSWVPGPVRQRILEICGRQLSRNGLAYISYNTLPGWRLHQAIRDMAMFHSGNHPDPALRVAKAREVMAFAVHPSSGWGPYKALLENVNASWRDANDWYLAADHAAPVNEAFYYSDFVRLAGEHGLRCIADADASVGNAGVLPPAMQQQLAAFAGGDEVKRQQYIDFLNGRTFRASILCRADAQTHAVGGPAPTPVNVAGRLTEEPDPASPTTVHFGPAVKGFRLTMTDPSLVAAFRYVSATWPHTIRPAELVDIVSRHRSATGAAIDNSGRDVGEAIMAGWRLVILDLRTRPTDFLAIAFDRPRATPLARLQVAENEPLINLRHQQVPINDATRALLPLLDGTRTRADLLRDFTRLISTGELKLNKGTGPITPADDLDSILTEILTEFSNNSLLMA